MRFLLPILLLMVVACSELEPKTPCIVRIDSAKWNLEIAKSEEEREKGLMFRSYMPEENGMIFVFSTPHEVSMWMKSTYIPLDMLFLDPNLYVNSIKESAVPLSEDIIRGPKNAAYVLELNAGQIEQYHIKIGDKLDISQCPALVAK